MNKMKRAVINRGQEDFVRKLEQESAQDKDDAEEQEQDQTYILPQTPTLKKSLLTFGGQSEPLEIRVKPYKPHEYIPSGDALADEYYSEVMKLDITTDSRLTLTEEQRKKLARGMEKHDPKIAIDFIKTMYQKNWVPKPKPGGPDSELYKNDPNNEEDWSDEDCNLDDSEDERDSMYSVD